MNAALFDGLPVDRMQLCIFLLDVLISKVIVLAMAPLRGRDRVPVITELDFPVNEDDASVYTGLRTPVRVVGMTGFD